MVAIIPTQNMAERCAAYFLAGLLSSSSETALLPTSNPGVTAVIEEALHFIELPYEILSLDRAIQIAEAALGEPVRVPDNLGEDEDALEEIYRSLFPGRLTLVGDRPSTGGLPEAASEPVVVAYGVEGMRQALPFGLLTGRRIFRIEDPEAEGALFSHTRQAASYFIALPSTVASDRIEALLASKDKANNPVPVGFFYPFGQLEREIFWLKAFLYSRYPCSMLLPYRFLYLLEPESKVLSQDRATFVLGKGNGKQDLLALLRSPAEFLFATPHSNGVDMSLGDVVLCAREDFRPDGPIRKAMPCFFTDICSRKSSTNERIGASSVKSHVVFFYTCWGVLLNNSVYDVETSLAHQIARSPYTAALATTYTMSLLDRASGVCVALRYSGGEKIGAAIGEFNVKHYEKYADVREVVLLFGDPELRTGRPQPVLDPYVLSKNQALGAFLDRSGLDLYLRDRKPEEMPGTVTAEIPDSFFSNIAYTRAVIQGTRQLKIARFAPPLDALDEKTEALWSFGMMFNSRLVQTEKLPFNAQRMAHTLSRLYEAYHRAWVEFYTGMVGSLGGYIRLQIDRYFRLSPVPLKTEQKSCPYCGTAFRSATLDMVGHSDVRRRLMECLNCATIFDGMALFTGGHIVCESDWQYDAPQAVVVEVTISLDRRPTRYQVAALLEPFQKQGEGVLAASEVYGALESDQTQLRFALPPLQMERSLAPGCYHLNVLVLLDESVLVLRRPVYVI